jgi:transketolase
LSRLGPIDAAGIEAFARTIRLEALRLIAAAGSGHPGPALSIADVIAVLYQSVLRTDPRNPRSPSRDRFILSKGHGCAALYAALLSRGFFDRAEASAFRTHGGILQGHPRRSIPGVDATTGPLGLGASIAAGMALARQRQGFRVYALLGDGELQAGLVWEAAQFAAHRMLTNLTYVVDRNGLQFTGATEAIVALEPVTAKWRSFGWDVSCVDGHDVCELHDAFGRAEGRRPHVVIAKTIKGKGVSFMECAVEWHGRAPSPEELQRAEAELGVR